MYMYFCSAFINAPPALLAGMELSRRHCLFLCSLGPGTVTLTSCDNSPPLDVSHSSALTERLLRMPDADSALFALAQPNIQQFLASRLLLVYDPRNPTQHHRYAPRTQQQQRSGGDVMSNVTRREEERQRCSEQCSIEACELKTDIAPQVHRGLRVAIADNGGIAGFLFLFAKVRKCNVFLCL